MNKNNFLEVFLLILLVVIIHSYLPTVSEIFSKNGSADFQWQPAKCVFEGINHLYHNNNNSDRNIYILKNYKNCFIYKKIDDKFELVFINYHPRNKFRLEIIDYLDNFIIGDIKNKSVKNKFLNFLEKTKTIPEQN